MSDTALTPPEPFISRAALLPRLLWIASALVLATLMILLPGQETIPFHLIWIGLCLMFGFTRWRPIEMVLTVVVTTLVTGTIMVHHAAMGWIEWPETAEVPLSVLLTLVIALYLRRRHMALAELARLAQTERRRTEARQQLVRQASHELRTPITVARGYTELMRDRLTDDTMIEDATVVLEELDKLAQITQRLLTLMQIDDEFDREQLDLDAELRRIVRRWMPAADRQWRLHTVPAQVRANRDRLEAGLDCLLDNAVKFTAPGDVISVAATADGREWTVAVSDTGTGMPEQVAAAVTAATPLPPGTAHGTGLGLATVRTIVGRWGGTMTVQSAQGSGTTVVLAVPTGE